MRLVDLLRECADDQRTCGVRQSRQLGQMFIDLMPCRRALARGADQQRAFLRRGQCDRVTSDGTPRLRAKRLEGVESGALVELSVERADE
jgi:hypothetical protein